MLWNFAKRILLGGLACCALVLMYIPANAEGLQDDFFTYELTDEGTARLTGTVNSYPVGHLEIPATVQGYAVTEIAKYAFDDYSDITSVTIAPTVECIQHAAFRGCIGLTSIAIPESVTYLGEYVFNDCTNLSEIDLPETAIEIEKNCF